MSVYPGSHEQRWGGTTYAQHGDDLILLNLIELLGLSNPSWLDIGAHHPTTISNTRLLYDRGMRGVNVEANPFLIKQFYRERKFDTNICVGVAPEAGEREFFMHSDLGGRNTFCPKEAVSDNQVVVKSQVLPVKTLNQIVNEYCNYQFPELLLMDIEGLDYSVLDGADFSNSKPHIICVETRRSETLRMSEMLRRKGFRWCFRMVENCFFVRAESESFLYE